jgi:hypothetical protein
VFGCQRPWTDCQPPIADPCAIVYRTVGTATPRPVPALRVEVLSGSDVTCPPPGRGLSHARRADVGLRKGVDRTQGLGVVVAEDPAAAVEAVVVQAAGLFVFAE